MQGCRKAVSGRLGVGEDQTTHLVVALEALPVSVELLQAGSLDLGNPVQVEVHMRQTKWIVSLKDPPRAQENADKAAESYSQVLRTPRNLASLC